jgi:hypothetical protein
VGVADTSSWYVAFSLSYYHSFKAFSSKLLQLHTNSLLGAKEFGFVAPKVGSAIVNVGDSLRFASGHTMQSCIHRVVPLNPTEHRYSIAYFLRAEDETMFTDAEGRYITAGQWHDEKFYTFMAPEYEQQQAPSYLLLGGMKEGEAVEGVEKMGAKTKINEVKVY